MLRAANLELPAARSLAAEHHAKPNRGRECLKKGGHCLVSKFEMRIPTVAGDLKAVLELSKRYAKAADPDRIDLD